MRTVRIADIAHIVRSKNAGPFELTLDVFFNNQSIYQRAKDTAIINRSIVSRIYQIAEERICDPVYFDPIGAVKVTLARPIPSGAIDDTDVYGCQQHVPLLMAEVPWE